MEPGATHKMIGKRGTGDLHSCGSRKEFAAFEASGGRFEAMGFRPLTRGEKIFLWGMGLALVCIFGMGTAAIKWFSRDLPSMERLEMIEPALKTRILARDSTIIKEFYEENRIFLPFDQIPSTVQKTFLAVEDRRFYEHSGIDLQRIFVTV
jgi:penicillin-binding protein 1A